jgi:Zn-dependent protease with chaperone function
MLAEACQALDMEQPELYVKHGPLNAYTSGHHNPYIVVYTGLVEAMSDAELKAVIAHEAGHIKCSHVLYKEMVRWLVEIGMQTSRRSSVLTLALQLGVPYLTQAMSRWNQMSELSADRAAMLVVRDEDVCLRMFLKLAGAPTRLAGEVNLAAFLEQAQRLQDLEFDSKIARRHRHRLTEENTHPLAVERARQLHRWIADGGYQQALDSPCAAPTTQVGGAETDSTRSHSGRRGKRRAS